MLDQNQQVSGAEAVPDLPNPEIGSSVTSPTSAEADEIVSKIQSGLLKDLRPLIEETIERKFKSTTDKRFSKLEKAIGTLDLLAELEGQGVSIPKEVKQEMRLKELEERLNGQSQPVREVEQGTPQPKQAVTEAVEMLQKYGLNSNDPEFIELLRGKYSSRDAFNAKINGYVLGKVAPKTETNPTGVVTEPAKQPASGELSQNQLEANYQKEMTGIVSTMSQNERIRAITALKDKYTRLGLPKA